MTNPARLLADTLDSWTIPASTASQTVRANGDSSSLDFWDAHQVALGYLEDVRTALRSLRVAGQDVRPFETALPAWYGAVFSINTPWGQGDNVERRLLQPLEEQMLRAFATLIDGMAWVPVIETGHMGDLLGLIDDISTLVREDVALPVDARRYILGLLAEAKSVLEEHELYGSVRVRQIMMELGGALTTTTATIPEGERRDAWATKVGPLLLLIGGAVGSQALQVGGGVLQHVLTAGT
jgi:hypothetical protein